MRWPRGGGEKRPAQAAGHHHGREHAAHGRAAGHRGHHVHRAAAHRDRQFGIQGRGKGHAARAGTGRHRLCGQAHQRRRSGHVLCARGAGAQAAHRCQGSRGAQPDAQASDRDIFHYDDSGDRAAGDGAAGDNCAGRRPASVCCPVRAFEPATAGRGAGRLHRRPGDADEAAAPVPRGISRRAAGGATHARKFYSPVCRAAWPRSRRFR